MGRAPPVLRELRGVLYALFGIPGTAGLALVGEGGRILEGQP